MPSDLHGVGARFNAFAQRHSLHELIVIEGIWARLALVDIMLKIAPLFFKRRWLFGRGFNCHGSPPPALRAEALRLERLVAEASSHPFFFNMSCLRRALVLRSLLAAKGIPSRLVFGMRGTSGAAVPEAHAWLELYGLTLGLGSNSETSDFAVFRHEEGQGSK